MKKLYKLLTQSRRLCVLIAIGAVIGFAMAGCDDGGSSVTDAFTGTYAGNAGGANFTLTINANNTWAITVTGQFSDTGTYTKTGDNTANIYSNNNSGNYVGTVTKNGNTLITVLVGIPEAGTYTAAKVSG
jgi:hypothetical protein